MGVRPRLAQGSDRERPQLTAAASTLGVDMLGFGTTHNHQIGVPYDPALIGRHLCTTSAVFVPGINGFDAITGNGIDGHLGDF